MKYVFNFAIGVICFTVLMPLVAVGTFLCGVVYFIWTLDYKKGYQISKGAFVDYNGTFYSSYSEHDNYLHMESDSNYEYWSYENTLDFMLSKKTWHIKKYEEEEV